VSLALTSELKSAP